MTKLRLLLDEDVQREVGEEIRRWNALDIKSVDELSLKGTKDPEIIAYAKKARRIVVTFETRMNEHQYPICTHPGIIVVRPKSDARKIEMFRSLMLSGLRAKCAHAVTYLYQHGATFKLRDHRGVRHDIKVKFGHESQPQFPTALDCAANNWAGRP